MAIQLLRSWVHTLFMNNTAPHGDDDATMGHEALHGDSALIRLVCELRTLETALADDTAAPCR